MHGVQRPGCRALRGAGALQIEEPEGEPGSSRVRCNALLGGPMLLFPTSAPAGGNGVHHAGTTLSLLREERWNATVGPGGGDQRAPPRGARAGCCTKTTAEGSAWIGARRRSHPVAMTESRTRRSVLWDTGWRRYGDRCC